MTDNTIPRLTAAIIDAHDAVGILDAAIGVAESRPEEPTEAQLLALLEMTRAGMIMARDRLRGFGMVPGSILGDVVTDAIEKKERCHG